MIFNFWLKFIIEDNV